MVKDAASATCSSKAQIAQIIGTKSGTVLDIMVYVGVGVVAECKQVGSSVCQRNG